MCKDADRRPLLLLTRFAIYDGFARSVALSGRNLLHNMLDGFVPEEFAQLRTKLGLDFIGPSLPVYLR